MKNGPAMAMPRGVLLLFALVAAGIALQGLRGLWEPDEGRYTQVAVEMLRTGDWLHPMLHPAHPHDTKPPLTYWAMAASMKLFGHNEWAVRLPSNLAFLLTLAALYWIGLTWKRRRPWLAPLVYGTFLLPFLARNIVTTDSILAFWETLGAAGLIAAAWESRPARRRLWSVVGWLGFALAFMTKGPPGLLPLLPLLLFALLERRRRGLGWLLSPMAIAAFFVAALWWFAVVIVQRPELLGYYLRHEVAGRVLTAEHDRNAEWYGALRIYVPAFLLGALPWTWPILRRCLRLKEIFSKSFWSRRRREHPELVLLSLWVLLPAVVFFLARSRLHLYVLPLFAPLALLCGRWMDKRFRLSRPVLAGLAAWVLILSSIFVAAARLEPARDARRFARTLEGLVSCPVDELVFLDGPAAYGLGFYLGVEVRAVPRQIRETSHLAGWIDTIDHLDGRRRLWVAGEWHREAFRQAAERLGCRIGEVGTYGRWSIHSLECPVSRDPRPKGLTHDPG